ncbi:ParA family protein [Arsenicibacter rosenii]|uniref:Cobyrinic acid ac-diamide synthase n=1 Tax=Arsenicibacter rosenii TaxID=1750698 RepID=A0A1S2VG57_9BACT|nr:ParA family protein [Arsenicibacter rosenii]OIN57689.1 cobyrinic acid ac-diamide synthase [Arsenicibacter rosenii]
MSKRPITISITNNKGGTGKTTTALNLGAALQKKGFRVLLIDLDAQGNLTLATGCRQPRHHAGELLMDEASWEETLITGPTVHLIPASRMLLSYEHRLNAEPDSGYLLREQLENRPYDYVIIDCPPSLGALTFGALSATDWFIVPMQGENFAYIGLDEILQCAAKVRRRINPGIKLAGILMNKFDLRTKFGQSVYQKLSANPSVRVFNSSIRQDISLMECTAFGQSIFDYAPNSRGARDLMNFCDEFLQYTNQHETSQVI